MNPDASPQQIKSLRAQKAICAATIASLEEVGYAETSLNLVARRAGFSKGALQHHFPSKEDLIAATVDLLLARTFEPQPAARRPKTVEKALMNAWTRYINTPDYRALMEILNALRTDRSLQQRLSDNLRVWGRRMDEQALEYYESVTGDDEEVVMLLHMYRSFLRGLLLQENYGVDAKQTTACVERWISLIAPLLKLKNG